MTTQPPGRDERPDGDDVPAFRLPDHLTLGFGSPELAPAEPEGTGAARAAATDAPVPHEAADVATPASPARPAARATPASPASRAERPTAPVSAKRPAVSAWGTAAPSGSTTRITDLASETEIAAARRARLARMAREARGDGTKEREDALRSWRARGEAARKAGPPSFAQRRADWWRSVRYFFEDDEKKLDQSTTQVVEERGSIP